MRSYANRTSRHYRKALKAFLSVDGPLGLRDSATELPKAIIAAGAEFSKCVNIDYCGFAGTILFDAAQRLSPFSLFRQLEGLAASVDHLNADGVAVRIRILLVYPYSACGQARIHAESTSDRSSVEEPRHRKGTRLVSQLTKDKFLSSQLYRLLVYTLCVYHEWAGSLGREHALRAYPNRLELRLSAVNPILCGLRVNGQFLWDPYIYAKIRRHDDSCAIDSVPVAVVNKGEASFEVFCDHFRYIWECDTTLDLVDAVEFSQDGARILPPREIRYKSKVARLESRQAKMDRVGLRNYEILANRLLQKVCPDIHPERAEETAFIACSWLADGDAPKSPNKDARAIRDLFLRHFSATSQLYSPGTQIRPEIVEASAGEELRKVLYASLAGASLGVVILSASLRLDDGRFLAAPNVYHELGYLMARLGAGKTFVFREERVEPISNMGDVIQVTFTEGKIRIKFPELLIAMMKSEVLRGDDAEEVAESFLEEAKRDALSGALSQSEYGFIREKVRGLKELKVRSGGGLQTHPQDRKPRLGDILVGFGYVERSAVEDVVADGQPGRIGERLIKEGVLSREQLDHGLAEQRKSMGSS